MHDEADRKRGSGWIIAAVLALPVLYVLSIGPAIWIADHISSKPYIRCFQVVYWPLRFLDETPAMPLLEAYAQWWDDL